MSLKTEKQQKHTKGVVSAALISRLRLQKEPISYNSLQVYFGVNLLS